MRNIVGLISRVQLSFQPLSVYRLLADGPGNTTFRNCCIIAVTVKPSYIEKFPVAIKIVFTWARGGERHEVSITRPRNGRVKAAGGSGDAVCAVCAVWTF